MLAGTFFFWLHHLEFALILYFCGSQSFFVSHSSLSPLVLGLNSEALHRVGKDLFFLPQLQVTPWNPKILSYTLDVIQILF